MTKFAKLILYSSITLLLWSVMVWFNLLPWYALMVLLLFVITRLVFGAIYIQQNFFLTSMNSLADSGISEEEQQICLTFDDGIHPIHTPQVLDILKEKKVRAMFFLIGSQCIDQEAVLKRIQEEGHVLGNHSFQHDFWFDLKKSQTMLKDIQQAQHIISQATSITPRYFRPPYGVTNPNLAKAIKQSGLQSVGWNLRSLDTVTTSKEALLHKLKSETKPNSIVLLHDRCELTVQVLTEYIDDCLSRGYTFVTL